MPVGPPIGAALPGKGRNAAPDAVILAAEALSRTPRDEQERYPMSLQLLGTLAILGFVAPPIWTADRRGEFPLDLAFSRRQLSAYEQPVLSPDGKHVAYAVWVRTGAPAPGGGPGSTPVTAVGHRVHVSDTRTGTSRAVGPGGVNSFRPAWSPDGKRLAFYCDQGGRVRLWVYELAARRARLVGDATVQARVDVLPPAWTNDGRELLIPTMPAATPERARPDTQPTRPGLPAVTVFGSGDEEAFAPRPRPAPGTIFAGGVDLTAVALGTGRRRLVVPVRADPAPAVARLSPTGGLVSYLSPLRPGPAGALLRDLVVVRLADGKVVFTQKGLEVTGEPGDLSGVAYQWHPSADRLVFLQEGRAFAVDCATQKPASRSLAAGLGRLDGGVLAFSRDGKVALVALSPGFSSTVNRVLGGLAVVPLDGKPPVRVPLPAGVTFQRVVTAAPGLLWQPKPGTATVLGKDPRTGQAVLVRVGLAGGKPRTLRTAAARFRFHAAPRDHSFLVGAFEDPRTPLGLYRFGADGATHKRLSVIEPRLAAVRVGPSASFHTVVPGPDGKRRTVRSAVLLPPGKKRGDRLPAVVTVYGGDDIAASQTRFGGGDVSTIPAPVFTTRGYAVLLVDAPLGPEGKPGQPAAELRDGVLPQVYRAAALGYLDLKRLAVTGQSYGGYSTAALVAQTNLFRAAVAVSGVYDLGSVYGWMGSSGGTFQVYWAEKGQGRMGKPLWDDPRRYLDNSPYYRADRIRTPLLLIHGRDDDTCPPQEAEKLFNALRRLGRTAQLAVYEGEGHVLAEWSSPNALDATRRILAFLDRRLADRR
jgi:dipeptidyl aminopeptidase/acylaminoacyl peptidase